MENEVGPGSLHSMVFALCDFKSISIIITNILNKLVKFIYMHTHRKWELMKHFAFDIYFIIKHPFYYTLTGFLLSF